MTSTERREPQWINERAALAIHERQLAEHGGLSGVRDASALSSALARPINRWTYGDDDPAVLAAAYAFGIARNHPFADGNKRVGWATARIFLMRNEHHLAFEREDAVRVMLALAAGNLSEDDMADWFRQRLG